MSRNDDVEVGIKSIQIIKIEGNKFTFDFDAFAHIVEKNEICKDLPVAVIIINGALRTGKSFFSNFIIRHLKNINKNNMNNVDSIDSTDSTNNINNIRDDILIDYFVSRRGTDIQTLGIWALDEIFVYDGKAIVLMDTQGIFDQELNQAMTIALISLSTIVSSYQIYNLDKRIQEDHLCNMAYFSAYSSLISNTDNTKIGQTLCLLVRDWANFDNNYDLERCDSETEAYKSNFLENTRTTDKVKLDTRKKIHDTYDNVVVRLCPHPGHIVTEGKFSGRLSEVREDFKIHVEHIIKKLLIDLESKRIGSNQTLLCGELPVYLREYVNLYENVKDSLPEAMTILATTEKICQENARNKTVHFYREQMMSRIKTRIMNKEDINAWHESCARDAHKFFNKLYIMGKDEDIKKVHNDIMNDITEEHKQCLLCAKEITIFNMMYKFITDILRYINSHVDLLNELFLKNVFLFLGILYMFTSFLPFGSTFFAGLIRYVVCILIGLYACLYLKDQKAKEHNELCIDTKNI